MIYAAELSYLVKNLDAFKKSEAEVVYAYYNDDDTVPVKLMREIMEDGSRIKLLPVTEIGDVRCIMLAALVRCTIDGSRECTIIGDLAPEVYEFTVDGSVYKINVTKSFSGNTPAKAKPADMAAKPADNEPKDRPRITEFTAAIPTSAVPRSMKKDKFGEVLYDILGKATCDGDALNLLQASIGDCAAEAIEILNATGAMAALKDIVMGRSM